MFTLYHIHYVHPVSYTLCSPCIIHINDKLLQTQTCGSIIVLGWLAGLVAAIMQTQEPERSKVLSL
jgi:hypothetical protein